LGYLAPVGQYSAGGYAIVGFGRRVPSHVLGLHNPMDYSADGRSVTVADFDRALATWVKAVHFPGDHPVPKPTTNTLYLLVVDGSAPLTQGHEESCFHWLGYHEWSTTLNAPFAVVPYRCSRAGTPPDNDLPGNKVSALTGAITHELIEAITNPTAFASGAATGWTAPIAGVGQGEMADVCEEGDYYLYKNEYWVARCWSNQMKQCIAPQWGKVL
jgi:hypothetical protein